MKPHEREFGIGGIAIFVIIALVAILGGTFVYMMGKNTTGTNSAMKNTTEQVTVTPATPTPTSVVSGDSSDAGLAKDSADVDTKLQAANQDSVNVDAGMNDQQGNLSEQ